MRFAEMPGFIRMSSLLIIAFALVVSTGQVLAAGLTDSDIDQLKRQGEAEGWTFTISANPATEYSLDELCGLAEPTDWREKGTFDPMPEKSELPAAFDWRNQGGDVPIRNQGGCGSCWAFSTVGALECAIKIRDGVTANLSEQYLISCNNKGWSCGGGWFAHSYHMNAHDPCDGTGAVMESEFPYAASSSPGCSCPYEHPYTIESWAYIGPQYGMASVSEIKQAIVDYGPVSTCITANGAMQGYGGGIFNACTDDPINHAVVIVGWDDNQGSNGVWIIRNSWGSWWGEGGYMRIEYGCSSVGYGANYINYRPINVSCTNAFGEPPLAVGFDVECSWSEISQSTWDMGDGVVAHEKSVSHVYDSPGSYDVTVTVETTAGTFEKNMPGAVAVYADTLKIMSQSFEDTGVNFVEVPVSLKNYLALREIIIPITWEGNLDMTFDSFSTAGHRAASFEFQSAINYDASHARATLSLMPSFSGTGTALPPGDGTIVSLFFTPSPSATGVNPIEFTDYAIYHPKLRSSAGEYQPGLLGGTVGIGASASCCQGSVGDANNSGDALPTVADIGAIVDFLFVSGNPLACFQEADANQSGGINPGPNDITVADIAMIVEFLFLSGQPLPGCF